MSFAAPMLAVTQADAATAVLFYLFAIMTGTSAICVVASKNIVRTAVYLLFALIGVTGIYFLLSAEFLAAVQLVVYVGGTLILIVFGVMLTSKSPFSRFEPQKSEVVLTVLIGATLLISLVVAILRTTFPTSPAGSEGYPIGPLGQALLGDDLVPFELASVILLVVMIGAAYLAKRRAGGEGDHK
jgi:NADH-quinone oxidoreductase subunit J